MTESDMGYIFEQNWLYDMAKQEEKYLWGMIKQIIIVTHRFDAKEWVVEQTLPHIEADHLIYHIRLKPGYQLDFYGV
jgi:hypothetical protein